MRLGIVVKYLGATSTLGVRLNVSVDGYAIETVSRDYTLDISDQALVCAMNYADRLGLGEVIGICSLKGSWVAIVEGSEVAA